MMTMPGGLVGRRALARFAVARVRDLVWVIIASAFDLSNGRAGWRVVFDQPLITPIA